MKTICLSSRIPWRSAFGMLEKKSEVEMYAEVRIVGHLLGSVERMQLHRSLVDYILCDEDIVTGERGRNGLPRPAVAYYKNVIDRMWLGVNGWDN